MLSIKILSTDDFPWINEFFMHFEVFDILFNFKSYW